MSNRSGKCANFSKCTIAYRNEPIEVSGDFVCPECRQPLHESNDAPASKPKRIGMIAAIAGGALLALIAGIMMMRPSAEAPAPPPATTEQAPSAEPEPAAPPATPFTPETLEPEPATPPVTPPTETAETAPPSTPPQPPEPTPAEESAPATAEATIDTDPESAENKRIKEEVLNRIDAMPKLSPTDRTKLYKGVERSRGIGKVITIPFASAKTTLNAKEIAQLKTASQAPQLTKLLNDPAVVFVILGFADKKGDAKANLRISTARAESALQALRDKCGFLNLMHPVGMGGSDLFDSGDNARNRLVEVWAVLP